MPRRFQWASLAPSGLAVDEVMVVAEGIVNLTECGHRCAMPGHDKP